MNFTKTAPIPAFTFKRHEKLKSRKLTEQLFKTGKSFNQYPFRVVYLFSETGFSIPEGKAFKPGCPVQFGVGAGTRNFKKAVHRNRVKRLVREAWRVQKHTVNEAALAQQIQVAVFFMFSGKELPEYNFVAEKMGSAIKKLLQVINTPQQP